MLAGLLKIAQRLLRWKARIENPKSGIVKPPQVFEEFLWTHWPRYIFWAGLLAAIFYAIATMHAAIHDVEQLEKTLAQNAVLLRRIDGQVLALQAHVDSVLQERQFSAPRATTRAPQKTERRK